MRSLSSSASRVATTILGATFLLLLARSPIARASICPNPLSLQPMTSYATGHLPVETAVADFNGDGAPDIAVANSHISTDLPGTISILRGQPLGTGATGAFDPATEFVVGGVPLGLVTDDFNGDGHADLAFGDWADSTVAVLLGNGDGTFAAPLRFNAGERPYELVTGDFNGDGVRDIAVADNGESAARVLIGGIDGDGHWNGNFSSPMRYALSNLSLGIAAADLNGDGVTDLVATESYAGTVGVLLGFPADAVGPGMFQAAQHYAAGNEPNDIAIGDFNGDGHPDLAISSSGSGGIAILRNLGNGTFAPAVFYVPGPNCASIAAADVDGDGILDLLVTTSVQGQLILLKGNGSGGVGDGTFGSQAVLADCCFPLHVLTADLNLNGKPDAITCNEQSDVIGVFLDGCGASAVAPRITSVRDVPNDDGGKVFLTWTKSAYDLSGGAVNAYRVWRRIPSAGTQNLAWSALASASNDRPVRATRLAAPNGTTDIVYWEALATLPAQRLAGYGYTAATTQDSLPGSNPFTAFFVTALTSNIDVFYDSDVDSGYSVDNLPPKCPTAFRGTYAGGAALLQWATSVDPDFDHFNVYRGQSSNFTPGPGSRVASPTDTTYDDASGSPHWYKLSAVDRHGNESVYATLLPQGTTDVPGLVSRTFLAAPAPNPAFDFASFRVGWSHDARLSLAIYDQQGRVVRSLFSGRRPAGEASVRWDRRDDAGHLAPAGLYFLRFDVDGERFARRIVLLR